MRRRDLWRVVKVSHFPLPTGGRTVDLAKFLPIWAIVTPWSEWALNEGELNIHILAVDPDMEDLLVMEGGVANWTLEPNVDVWEFVPPRKVPGEVWAAIAKWRLTGEAPC